MQSDVEKCERPLVLLNPRITSDTGLRRSSCFVPKRADSNRNCWVGPFMKYCLLPSLAVFNPERFAIRNTCRINFKRGPSRASS